jgi:hypothetical protein
VLPARVIRLFLVIALTLAGAAEAAQLPASTDGLTVRAVRLSSPLRIDGELNEEIYSHVPPISGFVQQEPTQGAPATEKTELWILYDEDNIYVSARLWKTDQLVATEMRRDSPNIMQNDSLSIFFDTFYDRRNGFAFMVTPVGGRTDGQMINGAYSRDWNTVWDVETGRFDGGWTAEFSVPFKSLRYGSQRSQVWGFNVRRVDRWTNEHTHLTNMPAAFGMMALFEAAYAATLVDLETPSGSKNFEIKPYLRSDYSTDLDGDAGVDVKYGITGSLTADFTYNTDFAQVEADEQQINLTRFSLFFPEKRDFFLENQGLFAFGGGGAGARGDVPVLFYSRRIGLHQGREVPVEGGGRLTGRVGRYTLGIVNMQAGDERAIGARATNFSVVRLRRDLLAKSSIGVIATGRSAAIDGEGGNAAYGFDGTFAFYDNLRINSYWARSNSTDLITDDTSHFAQFDYAADKYGLQLEQLAVGANFNPEVGFVRRNDMRRLSGTARFSPRPRGSRIVRKYTWSGTVNHIESGAGRLETRERSADFGVEFHSSDRLEVSYANNYEFLPQPFRIASGVTLPVGGYDFSTAAARFQFAQQRQLSGSVSAEHGTFYNGHRTAFGVGTGRAQLANRLSLEPSVQVNRVELDQGAFTTTLVGVRTVYTVTPRMFTTALVQFNSANDVVAVNARLRWEYRPGSELFLVYNEERDTRAAGLSDQATRAVILKINRLWRF